jgi:hypothetical protein
MNEELKVTDSGVEYAERIFRRNDGKEVTVKLYDSMSPERLKDCNETFEEYKIRRVLVNKHIKQKTKGSILWSPYPFGKATKGMVYNNKNREVMYNVMQKFQEQQLKKEEEINE